MNHLRPRSDTLHGGAPATESKGLSDAGTLVSKPLASAIAEVLQALAEESRDNWSAGLSRLPSEPAEPSACSAVVSCDRLAANLVWVCSIQSILRSLAKEPDVVSTGLYLYTDSGNVPEMAVKRQTSEADGPSISRRDAQLSPAHPQPLPPRVNEARTFRTELDRDLDASLRVELRGVRTSRLHVSPLQIDGELSGALACGYREEGGQTAEDAELLSMCARVVEVVSRSALQADLRCEAAVQAERTRMSRHIHDTVMQTFTIIALKIQTAILIVGDQPELAWKLARESVDLARNGLAQADDAVWNRRSSATPEARATDAPDAH